MSEKLNNNDLENVTGGASQYEKWKSEAERFYGLPCFPVKCACKACGATNNGNYSVWCGYYTYDTPEPGYTRYNKAKCFACGHIADYDLPGTP